MKQNDYEIFKYVGRYKNGEKFSGIIVADSREMALTLLKNRGLHVTKITKIHPFFLKFYPVEDSQIALFFDGLARMLKVGIDWKIALENLIKEQFNPRLTLAIYQIKNAIEEGLPIDEAFLSARFFDEEIPFMIRAGVESGKLIDVLSSLKEYYEQRHKIKKSIRGALAYPLVMLLGVIGVVLFLAPKIIKAIKKVYDQVGNMELPEFTVIVISIIDFLAKYFVVIVLLFLAFYYVYKRLYKNNYAFKKRVDALYLKIPIMGTFIKKLSVYRFILSLDILYKAGVPFDAALSLVVDMQKNAIIKEDFEEIKNRIKKGLDFSRSIKHSRFIPDMAKTVISIGETTGQLSYQLSSLKEYMQRSFDEYVTKMTKIFEPLSIAVIGTLVLIIIGAIYLPFIHMMDAFKHLE